MGSNTDRDWVQILVAPVLISVVAAVIAFALNGAQDERQNAREEQRAEIERQIEENRAQDAAVQAYLSQMSKLMTEEDLRTSKLSSEVRTLAHARTMMVISRLDQSRKTEVLRFLEEAQLVQCVGEEQVGGEQVKCVPPYPLKSVGGEQPIIGLDNADLSGVQLVGVRLMYAHLNNTDLSKAHLAHADLNHAGLVGANLRHSDLYNADLTGADLTGADLHFATGITNEELEEKARSLEGAIMPDGSQHP
jgi:uncharacterized protein YjbI with pentapeptide repeats